MDGGGSGFGGAAVSPTNPYQNGSSPRDFGAPPLSPVPTGATAFDDEEELLQSMRAESAAEQLLDEADTEDAGAGGPSLRLQPKPTGWGAYDDPREEQYF